MFDDFLLTHENMLTNMKYTDDTTVISLIFTTRN